jgi:DNA-binding transcriptional ArsR family regulator
LSLLDAGFGKPGAILRGGEVGCWDSKKEAEHGKSFLAKAVDIQRLVYYHLVMEFNGYGNPSSGRLDATFAALADPTRRAILARLASGEASVNELAEPFEMSQPAISKHLKVLERAGLISRGLDAQRRPRKLEAKPLAEANEWLEQYRQFWEASFGRLDALLLEMTEAESKSKIRQPKTLDSKSHAKRHGRTKRNHK